MRKIDIKDFAKKVLYNRAVVSTVTAIAIISSSSALAVDKTMDLTIDNLSYTSTVTELETIACDVIRRANPDMEKGETVTVQEGSDGVSEVEYKVFYVDGVEAERVEISESVVTNPVDKIVEYGTAESEADSAPSFEYKYVVECTATAYDPSPEENGGYGGTSATGIPLEKGVIAVDPKVIPLGSRVYVEAIDGSWSYGYAVAGDTGGAIKGNRVDLLFPTKSECYEFGRRQCRVYVL